MQVRIALNKLKLTSEITSKSTNKYTLITIENFDLYQTREENLTSKTTSNITNKQQTNNKQITTNKKIKNIKEYKEEKDTVEKIINFYQNNLGELTPYGLQQLESYLDDFTPDIIIYAMQKAVDNGVRTVGYVKGILNSWDKKGLHNLVEIQNEGKQVTVCQDLSDEEIIKYLEESEKKRNADKWVFRTN